jgi:solute carrier family 6 amino acid transporter-like protein 5/7/9/14
LFSFNFTVSASFLFAYLALLITIGKPMYFMELSIAQFASKGPVRVWDMVPAARGRTLVVEW